MKPNTHIKFLDGLRGIAGLRPLLLAAVLLCATWGIRANIAHLPSYHGVALTSPVERDMIEFVWGFEATKGWPDTIKWFAGPWHQGSWKGAEIKYNRPLTSCWYYAQWQLFGPDGRMQVMAVLLALHLVVVGLLFLFLADLMGNRAAAVATSLWALNFMDVFGLPAPHYALDKWIDQPEMLATIPYIGCLWALLWYCRTLERKWLVRSLGLFFIGILVKEMAYSLPMMAALLLWYQGRLKSHWRDLAYFGAIAVAMFAFRYWALGGMGYKYGNNDSWFMRWTMNVVGGFPAAIIWRGDTLPLAVVCAGAALWAGYKRRMAVMAAAIVSAVGCYIAADRAAVGFEDSILLRLMMTELWVSAAAAGALVLFAWRAITEKHRSQVFGWLFLVVSYIPLMSFAVTAHAWYLPSVGWAIYFAYALWSVAKDVAPRLVEHQKNRKNPELLALGGVGSGT